MNTLLQALREWHKNNGEFAKLQHVYIVVAVLALFVAGIIGLANYRLGQSILFVAVSAAVVFIANGVVWAILQSFVLNRLGKSKNTKK